MSPTQIPRKGDEQSETGVKLSASRQRRRQKSRAVLVNKRSEENQ